MDTNSSKHWLALYTKVHQEFKAKEQLDKLSIENYLPVIKKIKKWSDRKKEVTTSLLTGYIFIHANEKERLLSVEQHSIVRCLFENGKPAVIPDWQIENLKKLVEQKFELTLHNGLAAGQEIEITDGPLTGIRGVIQSTSEGKYISVSIKLLNRTITAKITNDSLLGVA